MTDQEQKDIDTNSAPPTPSSLGNVAGAAEGSPKRWSSSHKAELVRNSGRETGCTAIGRSSSTRLSGVSTRSRAFGDSERTELARPQVWTFDLLNRYSGSPPADEFPDMSLHYRRNERKSTAFKIGA